MAGAAAKADVEVARDLFRKRRIAHFERAGRMMRPVRVKLLDRGRALCAGGRHREAVARREFPGEIGGEGGGREASRDKARRLLRAVPFALDVCADFHAKRPGARFLDEKERMAAAPRREKKGLFARRREPPAVARKAEDARQRPERPMRELQARLGLAVAKAGGDPARLLDLVVGVASERDAQPGARESREGLLNFRGEIGTGVCEVDARLLAAGHAVERTEPCERRTGVAAAADERAPTEAPFASTKLFATRPTGLAGSFGFCAPRIR